MTTVSLPPTKRARNRAQTTHDITAAALRQLEVDGASGLSLRSVARELGMSVAGLYRYFDTRDALLLQLVEEGFDDLGTALRAVTADSPDDLLRQRLHTYRRWALDHPRVFNLLFTDPIPDFVAPPEGPTDHAVRRALGALMEPFGILLGVDPARPSRALSHAMVEIWSLAHGFVMLEVFNHLRWASLNTDRTYAQLIDAAVARIDH